MGQQGLTLVFKKKKGLEINIIAVPARTGWLTGKVEVPYEDPGMNICALLRRNS